MRSLFLISLGIFILAGCSAGNNAESRYQNHANLPAKLFKNEKELAGKNYLVMGKVSGVSCQFSAHDSPPNITTARHDMLQRANKLSANAVILDKCSIGGSAPGCYKQATCSGTAINITNE